MNFIYKKNRKKNEMNKTTYKLTAVPLIAKQEEVQQKNNY